ncbi:unnamed protein product [Amoebophrya sp. A120]|nr:unnamed protein product [Amoebophrya sp. A120]|eukprot:GSA120T00025713001.1
MSSIVYQNSFSPRGQGDIHEPPTSSGDHGKITATTSPTSNVVFNCAAFPSLSLHNPAFPSPVLRFFNLSGDLQQIPVPDTFYDLVKKAALDEAEKTAPAARAAEQEKLLAASKRQLQSLTMMSEMLTSSPSVDDVDDSETPTPVQKTTSAEKTKNQRTRASCANSSSFATSSKDNEDLDLPRVHLSTFSYVLTMTKKQFALALLKANYTAAPESLIQIYKIPSAAPCRKSSPWSDGSFSTLGTPMTPMSAGFNPLPLGEEQQDGCPGTAAGEFDPEMEQLIESDKETVEFHFPKMMFEPASPARQANNQTTTSGQVHSGRETKCDVSGVIMMGQDQEHDTLKIPSVSEDLVHLLCDKGSHVGRRTTFGFGPGDSASRNTTASTSASGVVPGRDRVQLGAEVEQELLPRTRSRNTTSTTLENPLWPRQAAPGSGQDKYENHDPANDDELQSLPPELRSRAHSKASAVSSKASSVDLSNDVLVRVIISRAEFPDTFPLWGSEEEEIVHPFLELKPNEQLHRWLYQEYWRNHVLYKPVNNISTTSFGTTNGASSVRPLMEKENLFFNPFLCVKPVQPGLVSSSFRGGEDIDKSCFEFDEDYLVLYTVSLLSQKPGNANGREGCGNFYKEVRMFLKVLLQMDRTNGQGFSAGSASSNTPTFQTGIFHFLFELLLRADGWDQTSESWMADHFARKVQNHADEIATTRTEAAAAEGSVVLQHHQNGDGPTLDDSSSRSRTSCSFAVKTTSSSRREGLSEEFENKTLQKQKEIIANDIVWSFVLDGPELSEFTTLTSEAKVEKSGFVERVLLPGTKDNKIGTTSSCKGHPSSQPQQPLDRSGMLRGTTCSTATEACSANENATKKSTSSRSWRIKRCGTWRTYEDDFYNWGTPASPSETSSAGNNNSPTDHVEHQEHPALFSTSDNAFDALFAPMWVPEDRKIVPLFDLNLRAKEIQLLLQEFFVFDVHPERTAVTKTSAPAASTVLDFPFATTYLPQFYEFVKDKPNFLVPALRLPRNTHNLQVCLDTMLSKTVYPASGLMAGIVPRVLGFVPSGWERQVPARNYVAAAVGEQKRHRLRTESDKEGCDEEEVVPEGEEFFHNPFWPYCTQILPNPAYQDGLLFTRVEVGERGRKNVVTLEHKVDPLLVAVLDLVLNGTAQVEQGLCDAPAAHEVEKDVEPVDKPQQSTSTTSKSSSTTASSLSEEGELTLGHTSSTATAADAEVLGTTFGEQGGSAKTRPRGSRPTATPESTTSRSTSPSLTSRFESWRQKHFSKMWDPVLRVYKSVELVPSPTTGEHDDGDFTAEKQAFSAHLKIDKQAWNSGKMEINFVEKKSSKKHDIETEQQLHRRMAYLEFQHFQLLPEKILSDCGYRRSSCQSRSSVEQQNSSSPASSIEGNHLYYDREDRYASSPGSSRSNPDTYRRNSDGTRAAVHWGWDGVPGAPPPRMQQVEQKSSVSDDIIGDVQDEKDGLVVQRTPRGVVSAGAAFLTNYQDQQGHVEELCQRSAAGGSCTSSTNGTPRPHKMNRGIQQQNNMTPIRSPGAAALLSTPSSSGKSDRAVHAGALFSTNPMSCTYNLLDTEFSCLLAHGIKCKYVIWVWKNATCDAVFGFQKNLHCVSSKGGAIVATRRGHLSGGVGIKKCSKNL